ncbi:tetratricopeptide repeat protein [Melioribacter sp. OK-6-Me]|uniref:tetratricopeptide repeat protein n=1 Tax=unclassified Melioribacter TaxID=2627329 RepID=UPI003ED9B0CF
MNGTITEDKIKLIYEFNPRSSLFARVGKILLDEGNVNEAIEILNKGLELYPDYPTAYYIRAMAYAYFGKVMEARKDVHTASALYENSFSGKYYLEMIDKIENEIKSLEGLKIRKFFNDKNDTKNSIEDKLDELAEVLSKARIKYNPDAGDDTVVALPEIQKTRIVTETMAKIYEAQKNYKEAIAIYRDLAKSNPEKAGYFKQKIEEINRIIDTGLM